MKAFLICCVINGAIGIAAVLKVLLSEGVAGVMERPFFGIGLMLLNGAWALWLLAKGG